MVRNYAVTYGFHTLLNLQENSLRLPYSYDAKTLPPESDFKCQYMAYVSLSVSFFEQIRECMEAILEWHSAKPLDLPLQTSNLLSPPSLKNWIPGH